MSSSAVGSQPKKRIERKVLVDSKWVTIFKDAVISNDGRMLEYITASRSDSVIVIVLKDGQFVLGDAQFRPGADEKTLDFVGGRVDSLSPMEAAEKTLRREFLLDDAVPLTLSLITKEPLYVDSAFSTQKLYGYVAKLDTKTVLPKDVTHYTYAELLEKLKCLQCRAMLLEAKNKEML